MKCVYNFIFYSTSGRRFEMIDCSGWKRPLRSPRLTLTQHYYCGQSSTRPHPWVPYLPFNFICLPFHGCIWLVSGWPLYIYLCNLLLRFPLNWKIKNKLLLQNLNWEEKSDLIFWKYTSAYYSVGSESYEMNNIVFILYKFLEKSKTNCHWIQFKKMNNLVDERFL